jgi:integrase
MATYQKRGRKWRAIVRKAGVSASASFTTKAEAIAWAVQCEKEVVAKTRAPGPVIAPVPVVDLFQRYALEVSTAKRGERWETIRLAAYCRRYPVFKKPAHLFTAQDLASWRDARLKSASSATVNRDLNLISGVFTIAIKEWGVPLKGNPVHLIRRPKNPASRDRRVSDDEVRCIAAQAGWDLMSAPETTKQLSAYAFKLAIETAMRKGEILSLSWKNVSISGRRAHLAATKNGDSRDVPLSSRALELLGLLTPGKPDDRLIPVTSSTLDNSFRKLVRRAELADLRFHDSRHEAITRFAQLMPNVLELSAVSGHRSVQMLKRYYHPNVGDLAAKLG